MPLRASKGFLGAGHAPRAAIAVVGTERRRPPDLPFEELGICQACSGAKAIAPIAGPERQRLQDTREESSPARAARAGPCDAPPCGNAQLAAVASDRPGSCQILVMRI